jgi:hypothetical protein
MAKDEAYREAERRIEEACRTGETTLILFGMGLTELPDSLARSRTYNCLTSLTIS